MPRTPLVEFSIPVDPSGMGPHRFPTRPTDLFMMAKVRPPVGLHPVGLGGPRVGLSVPAVGTGAVPDAPGRVAGLVHLVDGLDALDVGDGVRIRGIATGHRARTLGFCSNVNNRVSCINEWLLVICCKCARRGMCVSEKSVFVRIRCAEVAKTLRAPFRKAHGHSTEEFFDVGRYVNRDFPGVDCDFRGVDCDFLGLGRGFLGLGSRPHHRDGGKSQKCDQ